MPKIVVLFNLKPGADEAAYENWARATDIPSVRALGSVASFNVLRASALLGSDAPPPYRYVETIEVADMALFGTEVAGDTMTRVAAEFRAFAADPLFMLCDDIA